MSEHIEYLTLQELVDNEIAPYYSISLDYPGIKIIAGTENISEVVRTLATEFKNRILDIKNIFRGIRKSNIIFHKSEYGQYRKLNIFRYRKIMDAKYETLKNLSPVYKPSDMIVKYKDTSIQVCKLLDILNMPYTGYYLLSQIKDIVKLLKNQHSYIETYDRMYASIVQLCKFENIKTQFPIVMAHFNTNHKSKTILNYKFSDLFNSANDFKDTDKVLGDNHTLLKQVTTVESIVLDTEKAFDEVIYLVEHGNFNKTIVDRLANIADIVAITFNAYGYSISRLNELLHNHVLNLESIGKQL